jgi:hypothetical protein
MIVPKIEILITTYVMFLTNDLLLQDPSTTYYTHFELPSLVCLFECSFGNV